jgi:Glycosyl hydrolase family 26
MPAPMSRTEAMKTKRRAHARRWRRGLRLTGVFLVAAVAVAGVQLSGGPRAQAGVVAPPPIPANGAYLGAFVAPGEGSTQAQSDIRLELSQLGVFSGTIGRPLGLVHVFQNWRNPVRNDVLASVASTGAIPVVDWGCISDTAVIDGSQDALITSYAQSLAAYGRPVFLRWFWEMNLIKLPRTKSCLGTQGASGYVKAWQHIKTIFQQQGATNVAFVWCPSVIKADFASAYYPGNQFVDWIGFDGYDRTQDPTILTSQFLPFYAHWVPNGKPMMMAETGATTDQAAFLANLATTLPKTLPKIKALLYYDSEGTSDWTLANSPGNPGLNQFIAMGQLPYFSYPFVGS